MSDSLKIKIGELLDEYPGSRNAFDLSVVVSAEQRVEFGNAILTLINQEVRDALEGVRLPMQAIELTKDYTAAEMIDLACRNKAAEIINQTIDAKLREME